MDFWRDQIVLALKFLEHDPTTACRRLEQVEAQLRAAMARSPGDAAALEPWVAYAQMLQSQARAAEQEWLAQAAEREREFRAREQQQAPLPPNEPIALSS